MLFDTLVIIGKEHHLTSLSIRTETLQETRLIFVNLSLLIYLWVVRIVILLKDLILSLIMNYMDMMYLEIMWQIVMEMELMMIKMHFPTIQMNGMIPMEMVSEITAIYSLMIVRKVVIPMLMELVITQIQMMIMME